MSMLAAPPEVEWRRLNPRMLLVHPITEIAKALPAIVGAVLAGSGGGDPGGGSRWGFGVAVIVAGFAVLRWFTTRYRITDDQIQLRYGLLRRRTMAAPVDRVRTVDVTSHLLHRLLGLSRVTIGTGTSDRKGRDRLILDGLTAASATDLRAELLHRRPPVADGPPSNDDPLTDARDEELARVEPGWLRYAPFTLTGAVTGLAVLGLAWRVISEGRVNLRRIGPLRTISHHLERWPLGLDLLVVGGAVVAFVALASTAGYVLAFWHFRLTRHRGGTLHVARGLITSRATSIERRRLHGVELSAPLLLRSVGGARCLAIATGLRVGRGSERGGEILLPPAPRAAALRVATTVLGASGPFETQLLRHPVGARRRRVLRALIGPLAVLVVVAAGVALAGGPRWLVVLAVLPVVAAVPIGLDRYRSLGHALIDGFIVAGSGSIVRRRCAVDVAGVIGWNLRTSWFQRRLGLSSLITTTAAGRQKYVIADVTAAEAIRFADDATPGLLTEFLA